MFFAPQSAAILSNCLQVLDRFPRVKAALEFFEWIPEPSRIQPIPASPSPAAAIQPVKPAVAPPIEPQGAIICSSARPTPQPLPNAPIPPSAQTAPSSNQPAVEAESRILPVCRGELLQFRDDEGLVWAFPRLHLVSFKQTASETILLNFAAHHVVIECHPAGANQPSSATTILTKILSQNPNDLFFAEQQSVATIKINPDEGYELP